ncbi:hypothetical protein EYW49_21975 [Siculibacillus lacustris]|uniref:Peptidoglycan binding-like domain-containing protein n=1 Tax=Siculibacillus lacustris TaxID=1549641 RepID=A0A4Q9VFB5_9HYPH|nr:peptidoglycan-binding protein [Siculibacillus lacustris]TBW32609.1 hypothetical protein EYW49_21975 [Siculibacillus lacustris]
MIPFETLSAEYGRLWSTAVVRGAWSAEARQTAAKILRDRARYEAIGADDRSRAPWWWIGVIHHMECGGQFDRHLANGDPLTSRTRQEPPGLPRDGKPPFTFEEGAVAALEIKHVSKVEDWSIERALYGWEVYNGLGYRDNHPETLSPYLWSGTNHYTSGKYVRDHVWSASAVSGQIGAAAILAALIALCPEIPIALPDGVHADPPPALAGFELEAVQRALKGLGYYTGTPDGKPGRLTTQAVAGFRHDHGMGPGGWDAACRDALDAALRTGQTASVSDARATAPIAAVADQPVVVAAETSKTSAKQVVLGGLATAGASLLGPDGDPVGRVQSVVDKAKAARGLYGEIADLVGPVLGWLGDHPALLGGAVLVGVGAWWWARAHGQQLRVLDLFHAGRDGG